MLGKFGQLLRAVADGSDPAAIPPPQEVIPTLEVGTAPPDWDYSKGVYRYCGYVNQAAAVGVRSLTQLWLPADTRVVLVLHRIEWHSDDTGLNVAQHNVALTEDDGAERPTDFRLGFMTYNNRLSAASVRSDHASFTGTTMTRLRPKNLDGGGDHTGWLDEPFIIWPGTGVIVQSLQNQIDLEVAFYWTERQFDKEELRGVRPGLYD